jgi:hypothetical protein
MDPKAPLSTLEWIDERLDTLLAHPGQWGQSEAVEMQFLLLIEMRVHSMDPAWEHENQGYVFETYCAYLKKKFPKWHGPASQLVKEDPNGPSSMALVEVLKDFRTIFFSTGQFFQVPQTSSE